jgi:hypothetical protein
VALATTLVLQNECGFSRWGFDFAVLMRTLQGLKPMIFMFLNVAAEAATHNDYLREPQGLFTRWLLGLPAYSYEHSSRELDAVPDEKRFSRGDTARRELSGGDGGAHGGSAARI